MVEKLMFDEKGNPFYRYRKHGHNDPNFEDRPPEQNGLVKELSINVILKRSGYDATMREKVWFGLQELQIKIPQEKALRYHYLKFESKAMSNICVVIVSPQILDQQGNCNTIAYTFNIQPNRESQEFDWVRAIGKPKTISALKAQSLLANKQVLAVLTDQGEQVS